MSIRVRLLKNHGVVVTRRTKYGQARKRFVRPDGALRMSEAVAFLGTNDMQLYRLARLKKLKMIRVSGERMIPLAEIRRLHRNRAALYPSLA